MADGPEGPSLLKICRGGSLDPPDEDKVVLKQRKNAPRLLRFDYTGSHAYFVTCATYKKKPCFSDKAVVDIILPMMSRCGTRNGFAIYIYCFMPDHLHMLLIGEEKSSLRRFMQVFKQESSFAFKREYDNFLWQRSYYDRVLRAEETLKEVAWYIMNNPVRRGFVDDYRSYAFSGSFLFDIKELGGRT